MKLHLLDLKSFQEHPLFLMTLCERTVGREPLLVVSERVVFLAAKQDEWRCGACVSVMVHGKSGGDNVCGSEGTREVADLAGPADLRPDGQRARDGPAARSGE
jgi:hypothetical protein